LPPEWIHRGHHLFTLMRTEVIAGQYLDLVSGVGDGSVAGALTVIRMKAARYTVTRPLQIGASLAGAGPETLNALLAFGDPLGDAFQLRDDVLGVFGDPSITGKPILDDLREGKPTVLIALARANADPIQADRLKNLFGRVDLDLAGAEDLRTIIAATGALDRVENMINVRAESAVAALHDAPITDEARAALATLAGSVVDRHR
jgi:geranylgeranyl diphosphate synthase type I